MSTETVDPRFVDIDQWPTEAAVEAMLAPLGDDELEWEDRA